jgi:hypothetical protein
LYTYVVFESRLSQMQFLLRKNFLCAFAPLRGIREVLSAADVDGG